MKYLILLIAIFFTGCDFRMCPDSVVTLTTHAIVYADRNGQDPIGYFTLSQERWAYDTKPGSDVTVEFRNTSATPVSFNFTLTMVGCQVKDAIINLEPGKTYHTIRYFLRYNALDNHSLTTEPITRK